MQTLSVPVRIDDPINARILAISEDKIQGFQEDPLGEISRLSQVELPLVTERIAAMLQAGTIRRVRQTLMATNLATGSLVAWSPRPPNLDGDQSCHRLACGLGSARGKAEFRVRLDV